MPTPRPAPDARYYQQLHDENPAFQRNNWMVDELPRLRPLGGRSLLEVGCGNGRFLDVAAAHWARVVGTDWARSPHLDAVLAAHANVSFVLADATSDALPGGFDIVCSADFLEHLPEEALPGVLTRLLAAGRWNLHKIACYDDGHSHLSILPPDRWLALWHASPGGQSMRVLQTTLRKGQADKIVLLVGNLPQPTPG